MLWVYGYYNYFNSFSARIVFIRQNLTYKDGSRTKRVKYVRRWPAAGAVAASICSVGSAFQRFVLTFITVSELCYTATIPCKVK